jgi:uncharacterized iron-regulated membrane protein
MSSSPKVLKYVRLTHLYFGVFIAPALIFFAFTGALQTFSFHETTRGSSYKPPAWAVTVAQLHKKQTTYVPQKKAPPLEKPADKAAADKPEPAAPTTPAPKMPEAPAPRQHNAMPLKIFFVLVSIGLFLSTLSGIYMCYKYVRNRVLITVLLIAGIVIPLFFSIL